MSLPAYSLHDLRTLRRRYFDEGATIADLVRDTPFTEHQVLGLLVGGTSLPQPLRRLVANALCGDGPESISTVLPRVLADLERAP